MERTVLLSIDCRTATLRRYCRSGGRVTCIGRAEAHDSANLAAYADPENRKELEAYRARGQA